MALIHLTTARAEPESAHPLIAHARLARGDRSDAGHDFAFRQMPVTHHALVARLDLGNGISPPEVSDFRLDGLRQQGTRPIAQNLSE